MAKTVPVGLARPGAMLINRNYALLWGGQMISSIGDFMLSATVVLWITQRIAVGQSWAPLAVSGELIAITAPTFLLGPFAGVFVDRWNKRRTMLAADLLRFVLIALLIPLRTPVADGLAPMPRLGAIYAALVLTATASLFFTPARLALVGEIVSVEQQARASGLLFLTLSVGITLGPALAAPLYFAFGPGWALLLDALSFLVSFVAILAIRAPQGASNPVSDGQHTVIRELAEGVSYFAGNSTLRTILVVTAITLFGSSAINALDIFFLRTNLHAPPELFGILSAGTGAGVLLGSLLATWIVPRVGVARSFWLGTVLAGALIVVYARQTEFGAALVTLAVIGVPSAWLNVAIGPLLLQSTPPNWSAGRRPSSHRPQIWPRCSQPPWQAIWRARRCADSTWWCSGCALVPMTPSTSREASSSCWPASSPGRSYAHGSRAPRTRLRRRAPRHFHRCEQEYARMSDGIVSPVFAASSKPLSWQPG